MEDEELVSLSGAHLGYGQHKGTEGGQKDLFYHGERQKILKK